MFDSVSKILNQYIKIDGRDLGRFDVYSIWAERGENFEDLYYACNVRNSWYIVFETDYIFSLEEAAKEAADIFESGGAKVTHWVAKLDDQAKLSTLPLEAAKDKANHEKLVLDVEGTYLRCAVLAIKTDRKVENRYEPTAYGYTS
ncbi:MAG TPA: hypothetical protein VJM46_03825 [Candidatus Saccharimonadales bacterium]|nr:hypothetical protein [Candidatus Saccharimonadales bacterium]